MRNFIIFSVGLISGSLSITAVLIFVVLYLSKNDVGSFRLLLFPIKISRVRVADSTRTISYIIPHSFIRDNIKDSKKKFGKEFIDGFHHVFDPRIGCEIKKSPHSLEEIKLQFVQKTGTRSLVETSKGTQLNYFLVDPLGATQVITTILVPQSPDSSYVLTCGSGRAYHALFSRDFADFFNSFTLVQ